jgi:predicted permease
MLWWLRARLVHVLAALRRRRTDAEIDEEIRFHLDMRAREQLDAGLPPEEAERAAERRFGSPWRVREAGREIRRGTALDAIARDVRYGIRGVGKSRGLTVVVVVIMALGIGLNTAIFRAVHAALIEPLPYDRPGELALIWSNFQKMGAPRAPASGVELREIRAHARSFRGVAGVWVGTGTLTGDGEPEQAKIANVTPDFFEVLGARPALGRAFPADGAPGLDELILSDGLWHRRFGADPGIVGRAVRVGDTTYTVVGVMAPGFHMAFPPDANVPADVQAWRPFTWDIYTGPTDLYFIRLLGRLAPGATLGQAQAEADAVAERLRADFSEFGAESLRLEVVGLHADVVREIRPALLALLAGASLVLLICCFNVMNLLLVRVTARRKELAVRLALGASRVSLARQLLTESLALCLVGGAAGIGVAWAAVKVFANFSPQSLARVGAAELGLVEVFFVAAVSTASGVVAGLAPIVETRKVDLTDTLKAEGQALAGRARSRLRAGLVVSEIALGFVLLAGAGLMVRTVHRLDAASPGFDPASVLTFEIAPPGESADRRANFVAAWEERVAALPGVRSVGAISHLPLDDYPNWYSPYAPEGVPDDQTAALLADYRAITPGYFRSMGARLSEGRAFDASDGASGRMVVIVDDVLARATWPGETAVGKRLAVERFTDEGFASGQAEVVGVVEHVKSHSLLRQGRGQIYIPYTQSARERLSFVVKTEGDAAALAPAIRKAFAGMEPNRAVAKVRTMDSYVAEALAPTKFTMTLAAAFGTLALALAAVGIYGVISYSVGQRRREMGVRMALGAKPGDILALVLREGAALGALGLLCGAGVALAALIHLADLLFEVTPLDPLTLGAAAAATACTILVACWVPARRAARQPLADVLRS